MPKTAIVTGGMDRVMAQALSEAGFGPVPPLAVPGGCGPAGVVRAPGAEGGKHAGIQCWRLSC
jgi:hypothetical protein